LGFTFFFQFFELSFSINQNNLIMKKKNLKNLNLSKKSISSLNNETLKGGTYATRLCTGLGGSCWCNVTITDCPPCPGNR